MDAATTDWSQSHKKDVKEYLIDKCDFHFRVKIQKQAGHRCGQVSSQASEVTNMLAKGRNPDGHGFARYKHPILMVVTMYNLYVSMLKRNYAQLKSLN